MIITYNADRKRFEAQYGKPEHRLVYPLVKGAGFKFDWDNKVWHTADLQFALNLTDYFDDSARAQANASPVKAVASNVTFNKALEESRATDADIQIPVPAGLAYLPYQKAGIAYALRRQNTLIGDEMGLGKTIQAIGIANADENVRSVLIVCPASLKLNWEREWRKWDVKGLSVGIAAGKIVPDTDVVIVNYDILDKNHAALIAREWDLLIADECHKVKNPDAARTQKLVGKYTWNKKLRREEIKVEPITMHAKRRVFLTGTPIVNRPVELWPIIKAFDPKPFGGIFFWTDKLSGQPRGYAGRYCDSKQVYIGSGKYAWDHTGSSNLPELQEKLRSNFMVRRLKVDVLKDLPPKRRQVVVLETDASDHGLAEIVRREREAYDSLKSAGLESETVAFESMSSIRQEVAVAKLPYIISEVREALEEVDKLVVMAHHKAVIEALAKEFGSIAVVVNADVSLDDRQKAVDAFQNDPAIKLFIGSIQAAGVGLTLTAASNIIFAELDWVPGNVSQAEDRCHRIGQVNPVLIKYLVLDKSVDARMADLLIAKADVIAAGLDNEVVKAPVEMPQFGIVEPPKPTTKVNGVEVEIESLIDQQTAKAIHAAIRFLADRCDGALELDGAGFNKFDSRFGKELAEEFSLTPKQALAGQKLVRKYQGQIPEPMLAAAGILVEVPA